MWIKPAVSKVYDNPQGITVERISAIIGMSCSKAELVEFLDNISWATKISKDVYSFSPDAQAITPDAQEETETKASIPTDFNKDAFIQVLLRRYPSGMQFDSIDIENYKDTYESLYGETLAFTDEELELRLKLCGIIYRERLFPAEGIIDSNTKQRLFAYIENQFAAGINVLYYNAIFSDLADAFAYCFSLTDAQMLKAYIEFTAENGKYYFYEDYMTTEENVTIDHSSEIVNYMLSAGKPLSYEDVYDGLSHISKDIIYREIHNGDMFLMDGRERYFHIDIFEFSAEDGNKIAAIFDKEIEENGYVIWANVYESIKEQLPIFVENNLYLSPLGMRNALAHFMSKRFNFDGEVISAYDSHLGMADLIFLFGRRYQLCPNKISERNTSLTIITLA